MNFFHILAHYLVENIKWFVVQMVGALNLCGVEDLAHKTSTLLKKSPALGEIRLGLSTECLQ